MAEQNPVPPLLLVADAALRPRAGGAAGVLVQPSTLTRLAWFAAVVCLLGLTRTAIRALEAGQAPVMITVDGQAHIVMSARPDVARLLADLELDLRPEDRISPAPATPLEPGLAVTIVRAAPALVEADGAVHEVYSHATTVGELLAVAGLHLDPLDEIRLFGEPVAVGAPLPARRAARVRAIGGVALAPAVPPAPLRLAIRRAVQITIDDGSLPFVITTTAPTIGEALEREHMTLYLGDLVQPGLGSAVVGGQRVSIERSHAMLITADGRTFRTRSRASTVGDALAELGLPVTGSDRVEPSTAAPLADNSKIRIVRVLERVAVEQEPIPFKSVIVPDDELELDQQRYTHRGQDGEHRKRYLVVMEDGAETRRTLTDDWVAAEPITRVLAYGRKIVTRSLDTPQGTVTYWRKVRMLATSYSKSTAGVPITSRDYGRTRLGLPMRRGIVAVDPSLISLGSQVYVPSYGIGLAADTGGGIKRERIDLGYDDEDLIMWFRQVDVYLLGSPPPRSTIQWILPSAQAQH